jgi:hypothetical protein
VTACFAATACCGRLGGTLSRRAHRRGRRAAVTTLAVTLSGFVALAGVTSAAASPLPGRCGQMHVHALNVAYGLTVESVRIRPGQISCAHARRDVNAYFASHAGCTGSGCFRPIHGLWCGGGNSGALSGIPLTCSPLRGYKLIVELRAKPLAPPA